MDPNSDFNKDGVKAAAMVILGGGSLLFGIVPAWFSRQNRRRHPLLISMLLCFGAGVLLATAIVHMLSEVKEQLPKYAELVFCIGFFIVYIVDELVHYCCGEAIQHDHHAIIINNHSEHGHGHSHAEPDRVQRTTHYGSDQETRSLLRRTESNDENCDTDTENANARICHTSHEEPCEQNWIGVLGLLCALSLHSFLEGLAIGVQDTGNRVLLLLLAVSAHKFVVAFCLGIELCTNTNQGFRSHAVSITVFAMGSVLGIGLGMCLVDIQQSLSAFTIPALQGLAGGTLLYVTVSEVLPREKARWHQNRAAPAAGLKQLLSVIIGFTVMTILNNYLSD